MQQHKNLQLRIVGLANSRQCIFNREGIDLDNWEAELKASTNKSSPAILREAILGMNIFNAVFVDCTASPAISGLYHRR